MVLATLCFADDDNNLVDCPRKSLAREVEKAKPGDTITFTGTCDGPIVVRSEKLTLSGQGAASIEAPGQNVVLLPAVSGVILRNFEVRGGINGILATNGAHFELTGITARNNSVNGVSLQTSSSAILTNVIVTSNGLHGLNLETGSAATITGNFRAASNTVFGINANGSSLTFTRAAATSTANALGIQVATAGNAFISDPTTTVDVTNNLATGLTVVSGAHMVSFGGRINATGNGAFGVSVNSNAGLDLDAGAVLSANNNRAGGVAIQQQSVMTVFNNPQFSGVPGFSTINANSNLGNGIAVLSGSQLTLANSAAINAATNGAFGLIADNGAGVTLRNTTLSGNTVRDFRLTFGARADIQTAFTATTAQCDASTLVRGFTCPL